MIRLVSVLLFAQTALSLGSYTPYKTKCPSGSLTRNGGNISSEEAEYVRAKQQKSSAALGSFLTKLQIPGLDVPQYMASRDSEANIALGLSGGGYRSMVVSAGAVAAMDARNPDAKTLGGLLQATNYMSSASGGSWLMGTLAMNNMPQVSEILGNQRLWQLHNNIPSLTRPSSWLSVASYGKIAAQVLGKRMAGYKVSLTDDWGLFLGRNLVASGYSTFSEIAQSSAYSSHDLPFPVCMVTALQAGDVPSAQIQISNPMLEATPVEFGSFDKQINAFVKIGQLGTQMDNGRILGDCTAGFDDASFFLGATSSLFNSAKSWSKSALKLVGLANGNQQPSAIFYPNPFKNMPDVEAPYNGLALYGADGAYSGMGIPLWPMVQPSRKVDMFFCLDADGPAPNNAPDGKTLRNLASKVTEEMGPGVFPEVPSPEEFQAKFMEKPLWMGCDVSRLKTIPGSNRYVPLFVEMPNHVVSYNSLLKTMKLDYSAEEIRGVVQNGFDIATASDSAEWAQCIGCSVILREFQRQNKTLPEVCQKCMAEYCYS